MFALGVDIGGTFTDFSLVDLNTGTEYSLKLPTDKNSLGDPVLAGMKILLQQAGDPEEGIAYITHGSTVAVNTVIERSGAKLGLLCTEGFGDVLELRRVRLRVPMRFNATRPEPLIPRERVREIHERTGPDGSVLVEPSEDDIITQASTIVSTGVEGIVVALLHSYVNPTNEQRVKQVIRAHWPELAVECSSEVLPQMREYERTVCTTMNAYVGDRVGKYIGDLSRRAEGAGLRGRLYITKSNGGCSTAEDAMKRPVQTLLSGPASGVVGAAAVASRASIENFLSFDMGGTSTDIGVIKAGRIVTSREGQVGDFPVILPAVEVTSVGAGGSSIAYSTASGVVRVGPRSAGSAPGPACYGLGGTEPTVTDALLVSGVLNASTFAGGRMSLRVADAQRAVDRLGAEVGLTGAQCADAIVRIACAGMMVGVKGVIGRHGLDPRDFSLVAYGGAGPVFAVLLARELGLKTVVVPLRPGTLCALGSLAADLRGDFVRTIRKKAALLSGSELGSTMDSLEDEGIRWLQGNGGSLGDHELIVTGAMRYVGQSWELDVPMTRAVLGADSAGEQVAAAFHEAHAAIYGHSDLSGEVELVELHLSVIGHRVGLPDRQDEMAAGRSGAVATRSVVLDGKTEKALVWSRDSLRPGDRVEGPAIVEQSDTTTVILPEFVAVVDDSLNMLVGRLAKG